MPRMTLLEALGAMLSTPLGCSGSGAEEDTQSGSDASDEVAVTDTAITSCYSLAPGETPGLKINEILYDPLEGDTEWVELFNKGDQPVSLKNHTISNKLGVPLLYLPDQVLTPCSYYVANFDNGAFNNNEDAVALYSGEPGAGAIIDFMAYSALGSFSGGAAHDFAVEAGIWDNGDFIDTFGATVDPAEVRVVQSKGDTLGRDRYSTDTDISLDWAALGGIDSFMPTPAQENQPKIYIKHVVENIDQQEQKEWAVLFYVAADNNLQGAAFSDLNKLEELGSTPNIHVAVMADLNSLDFDPKLEGIQSTAYIHVKKDTNTANSMKLQTIMSDVMPVPEANTGDSKTLADFLSWAAATFPAKRYYVVMWGHGGGWKGTASDTIPKRDRLTMLELQEGLGAGPAIGVISFMSCMMQDIAVVDQIKNNIGYMVASQDVIWAGSWGSWPWDKILEHMQTHPNESDANISKFIVNETHSAYSGDPNHTFSAVSINGGFSKLLNSLTNFADTLKDGLDDYGLGFTVNDDPKDNVQAVIREMLKEQKNSKYTLNAFPTQFTSPFAGGDPVPDFRDILDFVTRVQANNQIVAQWKNGAGDITESFKKVVIIKANGKNHAKAGGLSVYFPLAHTTEENEALSIAKPSSFDLPLPNWPANEQELFAPDDDPTAAVNHPSPPAALGFTIDSKWDEFLHRYFNPVADASCNGHDGCQAAPGTTVMLNAAGSSDSDGEIKKYCWDLNVGENTDNGDFDKDNKDENDDDCNDTGKENVKFTCPPFGGNLSYLVRLMTQDNHNSTTGHSKHFQVDDSYVTITCIEPM